MSRLSPSRLMLAKGAPIQRSLSSSRCGGSPSKSGNSSNGNSRSRTPTRGGGGARGGGDRFIPNRSTMDMEAASHYLLNSTSEAASAVNKENAGTKPEEGADDDYVVDQNAIQQRRNVMANILLSQDSAAANIGAPVSAAAGADRILSFRQKAPAADEAHINSQKVLYSTGKPKTAAAAKERQICTKADRILDAPEYFDDFYLNLIDWSRNNHMAVALYDILYIWNAVSGSITELFDKSKDPSSSNAQNQEGGIGDYISSVSWVKEGNIVAVGDNNGVVELWDVTTSKLMRKMRGHNSRVATLDWNAHILASGNRNGTIHLHDVRVASHHVGTLNGHSQEVCGMKWSPDQGKLLASGSNDNQVLLWDGRNASAPVHTLTAHQAAVKAVSWCPWQPKTLATGGGTNCRHVKFWNATTGNCINSVDTGSQVSGIVWNEEYKEIITSHGFSRYQLTLWKYPSMQKMADLKGHKSRILLLVPSPDGTTVASAAADETIRLWIPWPKKEKKEEKTKTAKKPVSLFSTQKIR